MYKYILLINGKPVPYYRLPDGWRALDESDIDIARLYGRKARGYRHQADIERAPIASSWRCESTQAIR